MGRYVAAGLAHGDQQTWRLSAAICAGLSGEAGPAGWAIGRVRSSGKVSNFDVLLAERVLGATGAGRRSTTIERSEEHTSELQSLMRISYADFCLKKKKNKNSLRRTTNKLMLQQRQKHRTMTHDTDNII